MIDLSRQLQVDDGTGLGRVWPEGCVTFDVRGFYAQVSGQSPVGSGWSFNVNYIDRSSQTVHAVLGPIWMVEDENKSRDGVKNVIDNHDSITESPQRSRYCLIYYQVNVLHVLSPQGKLATKEDGGGEDNL